MDGFMSKENQTLYQLFLSPDRIREAQKSNPFVRISDTVYDILEEAIISYQLKPGRRINISRIAEALEISDTPVREAVAMLVENGLLTDHSKENNKYHSYTVFDLDELDLEMLYNARRTIEGAAAYYCAEDNCRLDMVKLHDTVELFSKSIMAYIDHYDPTAMNCDREFHTMIVEATGNRYLIEMYSLISKDLRCLSARSCEYMARDPHKENLMKMCRQHLSIYNAIENGFPDMARNLMENHVDFCAVRNMRNRG